jgi:DNA-binding winged helix-turn-helix (wHTH) protein/Tfp pilus assembly protein PilF
VTATGYQFGAFHFDLVAYRVARGPAPLDLTPKLLDLLLYFLERPATLVTKEELLDALWSGANVTENALAQAVSELRQALGDDAAAPQFIRTVARRGYRFIAPVTAISDRQPTPYPGTAGTPNVDTEAARPVASAHRSIAVLDFAQSPPAAGDAWLSAGIAETVTNDLRRLGHFRVVDRRRVLDVVRGTDASLEQIASVLGTQLLVVGNVQRNQDKVRITSRIVDVSSGEALADAKVDGAIGDIFDLQDDVVRQLSRELSLPGGVATARDTASLGAFQAFTEGSLALESLDVRRMEEAVGDFERAVSEDPRYARAYAGLASAELACFESTRADNEPGQALLERAVAHAEKAIQLDDTLAEAHATLALVLVSAHRADAAAKAGRRAVALEPSNWRHWFRLGHATWGAERVRAAAQTQALYPEFAFSYFQVAMVHVARRNLAEAETVLRQGAAVQDRQISRGGRYPALGLHWLLGLVRLANDDRDEALTEFDREASFEDLHRLYGREYQMHAATARGAALMRAGRADEAIASFQKALTFYPDNAPALLGLADALRSAGKQAESASRRSAAEAVVRKLEGTRPLYAAIVRAEMLAASGQSEASAQTLTAAVYAAPPGFACWTIPIEPAFQHVIGLPAFAPLLEELAFRAR